MLSLLLAFAALLTLLALTPAVVAADPLDEATRKVGRQLQCPVCEGQTVADSGSGLAQDMRTVIRTRLEAGQAEQQILDSFVASYGPSILTDPPKSGSSLGLWVVPPIAVAAGALLWYALARAWERRSRPAAALGGASAGASPNGHAGPGLDEAVADELRRVRQEAGS